MITILENLEAECESTYKHLAFSQLKDAYNIKLICIPHNHNTFVQGLLSGAESENSIIIAKSMNGATTRLTVTKDVNGNRVGVVRNVT